MEAYDYIHTKENLALLNGWLLTRSLLPVAASALPKVGFIILHEGTPIAVAFLRQCEGLFGLYDSQATNPEVASHLRHEALDLLHELICNAAKCLGFTRLVAQTSDKSTIERSQRYGFRQLPGVLIWKDLL